MAHFAELDENNVVKRVVVIDNRDTSDANGVEKEHIGAAFCEKLFGGVWKQTSYNGNIRKRYAGEGMIYRQDVDAFITPQPFSSWTLNQTTCVWEAPIALPEDAFTQDNPDGVRYEWNEENYQSDNTTGWVAVE